MKRCFSRYRLALFAVSLLFSTISAEVIWRGTSTPDVIDQDLIIKDDVLLPLGKIVIKAINKDVTVVLTKDVVLSGHWAGESDLYLVAAEGRTIRFVLDFNLTFVGSSDITGEDLLIVQSGPGTVEVAIADGKNFTLTSQNFSGGTQYYVLMYGGVNAPCDEYCCDEYGAGGSKPTCCVDEYASGGLFSSNDEYSSCCDEYCSPGTGCNETSLSRPTLSFVSLENLLRARNINKRVVVGPNSSLGFLSSRKTGMGQDSGIIQFDAAMNGLSRMILEVQDRGLIEAAGHYTCQRNGECITSYDIQLPISAGFNAMWRVFNSIGSSVAAGLLVLDENNTFSDLLIDPFLNLGARQDLRLYRGAWDGKRYGVVLGANGTLFIDTNSYLDFVGLSLNQLPCVMFPNGSAVNKILKMRNPSAFIIDGNFNPLATDAQVVFANQAAFFLRSGVGADGTIRNEFDADPFTVDSSNMTGGVGNIVLDVEGLFNLIGNGNCDTCVTSKIELLSLEVFPTGGSVFVGSGETDFPLRTFNTEDNELLMYNKGAFLVNNAMTLYGTALNHTDEAHSICAGNDLRSEPAYIGGEAFRLVGSDVRPSIRFINSSFQVHTDVAVTGLDLVVPNFVDNLGVLQANLSDFTFFGNGSCVDNGTGRQMILGTRIGSTAADGCSRIDADAHLDIVEQDEALSSALDPADPNGNQTLDLLTAFNDDTINNLVVDPAGTSIHTIFLGDSSNISVGVNAATSGFNIDTNPWLRIAGNVFSFETRPGAVAKSPITGKNAIFVDLNGKFSIEPGFIANICVMVIKSQNGIVDLPAEQVFFCDGAGITTWDVDLSNPDDQIIIGPDQALSTYIFNWILAKKDCPGFVPFECCMSSCTCPVVTTANITSLPTIQGSIDDLQLQGTRIGDPAQIAIDGGFVRRITFSQTNCSAEAPVATIVLSNDGVVGLDSTTALGVNGVTIIANGPGQVIVNEDLVINNFCAVVKGPDFADGDMLEFYSAVPRQILVKSTGILNLASFTNPTQVVAIAGELKLVLEPGATIVTGTGTLRFAGNAQMLFEAAFNAASFFEAIPHGAHDSTLPITTVEAADAHNALSSLTAFGQDLHNTDSFRVKIAGGGTIEFVDNAQGVVPYNAFVGIETLNTPTCSIPRTDITLSLADNGTFALGHFNSNQGGVLQIGNVDNVAGDSVNFTLTLDGANANFTIGAGGFLGLGVGIERFDAPSANAPLRARVNPTYFVPNENIVNTLSNVGHITFNFLNGRFEHDRIFSGDFSNDTELAAGEGIYASLVAVGDNPGMTFNLTFLTPDENTDVEIEPGSNFNLAGGGNFVLIEPGTGGVHPIVLNQDGFISDRLSSSIMASSLLQIDNVDTMGLTGANFFDYFKTHDALLEDTRDNTIGRANAASQGNSFRPAWVPGLLGAVANGTIVRGQIFQVLGAGQENAKRIEAIDTAAVFAMIDPVTLEIIAVSNIVDPE